MLAGYSWISSEVLIASILLLGFVQVLNNLGERLAGGNLVAEGRFFRAVLWLSAQDMSCLANCFLMCILAQRSGSALWETAALCICILGVFLVLLIWSFRWFHPLPPPPPSCLGVLVHGISFFCFFSWATSYDTASCPPHMGQMLSLWCKQGRYRSSHPSKSLTTGKYLGVYLWIWVKNDIFYWSRSESGGTGGHCSLLWCILWLRNIHGLVQEQIWAALTLTIQDWLILVWKDGCIWRGSL